MEYDNAETEALKEFVRQKVSSIRLANGYSSRNLSLELNKSTQYLNQLENGRFLPGLDFINDFCRFFGITLTEFFDQGNAHPTAFRSICEDLSRLTDEEVTKVGDIIKMLANR